MTMSIFATGCGKGKDVNDEQEEPAATENPESTGPKVLRLAGMPATLNPHTSDSAEDSELIAIFMEHY